MRAGGRRRRAAPAHGRPAVPGAGGPLVGGAPAAHGAPPVHPRRQRAHGAGAPAGDLQARAAGSGVAQAVCTSSRTAPGAFMALSDPAGSVHAPQQGRWLLCSALTAPPRGAQIENEFGFLGPNEPYLRHLLASARAALGEGALIYTTDPPPNIQKGSLAGGDLYSCAPPTAADSGCSTYGLLNALPNNHESFLISGSVYSCAPLCEVYDNSWLCYNMHLYFLVMYL